MQGEKEVIGKTPSLTFKWVPWKKTNSAHTIWSQYQHEKLFHSPSFVCTYWVREDREEPSSSDLLPQPPPTSQPGCGFPCHLQTPCDSLAQTGAQTDNSFLLTKSDAEKVNLVKETVVGRWKQSQDLCIWTHSLNPVHLPWAQAGLQNCLPLPMKYLTLNLSEESKAVKSQESPHTPALEQKLPILQLKKTKQGAWGQDQKKGHGTVMRGAQTSQGTGSWTSFLILFPHHRHTSVVPQWPPGSTWGLYLPFTWCLKPVCIYQRPMIYIVLGEMLRLNQRWKLNITLPFWWEEKQSTHLREKQMMAWELGVFPNLIRSLSKLSALQCGLVIMPGIPV